MTQAISGSIGGSRRTANSRSPWVKRVLLVAGIVAAAVVAWQAWDRDWITKWKATASPLPFFIGMGIAPAFGIPFTPLFVLAGATFGRRFGLLGSGLALAGNLTLCYWIARSGLRPWLVRVLRRFDYELPNFQHEAKGSLRFTLLVKMTPGVPQFVKNYGLGVAGVSFPIYFVSSMLISGGYAVALILLGQSLFRHEGMRSAIIAGAVFVLGFGVWWWCKRRRNASVADG